ncbi:MAG: ceramidase domain-containing protein [Steroidobacteraceae bacterium]
MNALRHDWRKLLIGGLTVAALLAAFLIDPIAQDPDYHRFADRRPYLGIANFWNVATNLPFLVIGIAGLAQLPAVALKLHYAVFCVGVSLVAVGSARYHLEPSTAALVFDRLPMTIAFMALFAAVIADRVSMPLGRALLWPLVALGIASIGWWQLTEEAGAGDLRPYAVVQFLPMILIPLMLLLFRGDRIRARYLWAGLGAYAGAKLMEQFDAGLYGAGQLLGGHSLKHLLAALAAWWIIRAFQRSPARAL